MRSTDRFAIEDVRCDVAGATLAVTNLSVGGFFVACEPPLPLGQSVAFDLVFGDGWRASAVGRVAWVNAQDGWPRLDVLGDFMRERALQIMSPFPWAQAGTRAPIDRSS